MLVQAAPLCCSGSAPCAGSRQWGNGLAQGYNPWSLLCSHGQRLTTSKGWSELSQSLLPQDTLKPAFTVTNLPGTTSTIQTAPTTSTSMQVSSGPSFPITNYLAPVSASISPNAVTSANGTVLKTTGASAVTSGGLMPIPTGFTLMSGQCRSLRAVSICLCTAVLLSFQGQRRSSGTRKQSVCCCRVNLVGVPCLSPARPVAGQGLCSGSFPRALLAGPAAGKDGVAGSRARTPGHHLEAWREQKELVGTKAFLSPTFWEVLKGWAGDPYPSSPSVTAALPGSAQPAGPGGHGYGWAVAPGTTDKSATSLPELEGRSCL